MNQIRGMKTRISLEGLLDLIGLEHTDIHLGAAAVDPSMPDTILIVLRGEDDQLPVVSENGEWPEGYIEVTTDHTRSCPVVRSRIVTEDNISPLPGTQGGD